MINYFMPELNALQMRDSLPPRCKRGAVTQGAAGYLPAQVIARSGKNIGRCLMRSFHGTNIAILVVVQLYSQSPDKLTDQAVSNRYTRLEWKRNVPLCFHLF